MFILENAQTATLKKVMKMSGGYLRPHALAVCDNCGQDNYVRLDHAKEKARKNVINGKHAMEYICRPCAFGAGKYDGLEVVE